MKIEIKDSNQFNRLLDALVDEVIQAKFHFTLFQGLIAARVEYSKEFNQSQTFWWLTFRAHLDATLLRLCKAYDQYDKDGNPSLNLRNLLDTIAANQHFFDEPDFRERLKGNPFVDSLSATPRRPDPVQLAKDVVSVSNSDPQVKKLTIWRNNLYAHRSPAQALDPAFLEKYPLSYTEIEFLLDTAVALVNRYSTLFKATTHSTQIVGHDDYLTLLNYVRAGVNEREARIDEEIRRFTEGDSNPK